MAAVAVRKRSRKLFIKFFFSHCNFFFLLDQYRIEQNKQDEQKYSKSLIKMTSYAHWHAYLYLYAYIKTFINLI